MPLRSVMRCMKEEKASKDDSGAVLVVMSQLRTCGDAGNVDNGIAGLAGFGVHSVKRAGINITFVAVARRQGIIYRATA